MAIEEYDLEGLLELNDLRGNKPDEIVIELDKGGEIQVINNVIVNSVEGGFNVNNHVVVVYEGELFPGQVKEIDPSPLNGNPCLKSNVWLEVVLSGADGQIHLMYINKMYSRK